MTPLARADIASRTRDYLTENFLYMRPDFVFADEDSLVAAGILDSLGVMEMITFVEEAFGIAVGEREVTDAHFGSVDAIARFVESKQQAAELASTGVA